MMGTKIYCLLYMIIVPHMAFTQQQDFRITGKISNLGKPAKLYLRYVSDHKPVKDSCVLHNGRFRFRGKAAMPAFASLLLSRDGNGITWPYDELMFYIDSAVISIESLDSAKTAVVKGTSVNADFRVYRNMMEHQGSEWDASERFIQSHPGSYISTTVIQGLSAGAASLQEITRLEQMFSMLSPALKETKAAKNLSIIFARKRRLMEGMPAPDFSQPDTNGKNVSLSSFRGRPVLLHFWASWCKPCRRENKELLQIYSQYHEKGFEILSVSVDHVRDKWINAINEDGINWAHVSDLTARNAAAAEYEVHAFPTSFLIDAEGKIVAKDIHGDELIKKLSLLIK